MKTPYCSFSLPKIQQPFQVDKAAFSKTKLMKASFSSHSYTISCSLPPFLGRKDILLKLWKCQRMPTIKHAGSLMHIMNRKHPPFWMRQRSFATEDTVIEEVLKGEMHSIWRGKLDTRELGYSIITYYRTDIAFKNKLVTNTSVYGKINHSVSTVCSQISPSPLAALILFSLQLFLP